MSEPVRLDSQSIEALAEALAPAVAALVLEALDSGHRGESRAPAELLTAADVAQRFNVDRGWVYTHAAELGVIRLGEGRKPRIRFDARTVAQALRTRSASEGSHDRSNGRAERLQAIGPNRLAPIQADVLPKRWLEALESGP